MHISRYLALVKASEEQLGVAFGVVRERHAQEAEVAAGLRTMTRATAARLGELENVIRRYGRAQTPPEPERLRATLFQGPGGGRPRRLEDLRDLALLAGHAHRAWASLGQAAKGLRDRQLDALCERSAEELGRLLGWIQEGERESALVVPAERSSELRPAPPRAMPGALLEAAWAPAAAAILLGVIGIVGMALGRPWLLPSLGPTAFVVAEMPAHPSARFYNIVVGHVVALLVGCLSVAALDAWGAPIVMSEHVLTVSRLGTGLLASAVTLLVLLAVQASHPPAAATALLVALGTINQLPQALDLVMGAVVLAIVGVAARRIRLGRPLATRVESVTPFARERAGGGPGDRSS